MRKPQNVIKVSDTHLHNVTFPLVVLKAAINFVKRIWQVIEFAEILMKRFGYVAFDVDTNIPVL